MGNLNTSRDRLDLNEAMRFIGAEWTGEAHIAFDPHMEPQYRIRRACSHDGTLLFSIELMRRALENLFNQSSYYVPIGPPPPGMQPKYTIGPIKRFCVFRKVQVPAGVINGERECVVVPVKCEYVPLDA